MSSPENTPKPSVKAAIFQVDRDWRITSVNDKAGQMIGVPAEELVGLTIEEIFCSKVQFSSLAELCEPIAKGHVIVNHPVLVCTSSNDTGKAMLVSIIPLPEAKGSGGAIISMQDATEHTLLHQITLDFIADGVFTVDENWKITSFNKAAEKITGWTRKEVIGSACGDIFHSKAQKKMCLLKDSLKDGHPIIDKAIFMRNRHGNSIPVSISAARSPPRTAGLSAGCRPFATTRSTSATISSFTRWPTGSSPWMQTGISLRSTGRRKS
ncbi:hypothetical protein GF1_09450 [Desulfolithobacter dissulfuricans]|uniref:PAS domain-containing protein n=1 Tax=Desulfolithobacter dissulfuricans TaxID=2795293 RepID=A0A915XHE2_9BACT|nr:PAS domain-containing protein [Desulfolithobacter dissulfuricans]BCO08569.1 hypothetical protein GF1_09450 [Desulfolithobacter dissulfuricans]